MHLPLNLPALRDPRWLWTLPKIALPLLVLVIGGLVWLVESKERESERQSLINGALWAEQNLRIHLASQVELLTTLGNEFALRDYSDAAFKFRSRQALRNSPGLIAITWYWTDGVPQADYAFVADAAHSQRLTSDAMRSLLRRAGQQGEATFSAPYPSGGGEVRFDIAIPIAAGPQLQGYVTGAVSLGTMIRELVPTWYAQRYQLEVVDASGKILAAKSTLPDLAPSGHYETAFEPPGHGLRLRATRIGGARNMVPLLLAGATVLLGAVTLWSIFALRRHVRERLNAERELAREARFRKAMENSLTTGMRARDLEGRMIYVNRAFCTMTGFAAEELIGTAPPHPYWAPEVTEESEDYVKKTLTGQAPKDGFELTFRRRGGERFTVLIHEAPLIDEAGRHFGWMGSVIDISERKRVEELARQQQEQLQFTSRLVTMGEMASTLAHELNQPLTVINSYAAGSLNRLAARNAPVSELKPALEQIAEQATRAGKIINWVHEFVKRRQPELTPCLLNGVVERVLIMLEPAARRAGVTLLSDLPAISPSVCGDRVMLEQVLVNLVRNGVEAMQDTPREARRLRLTLTIDARAATVRVRDHGHGIDPQAEGKLFTPFYSSKARGMGMGLNACKSIIETHGGSIGFTSEADGGSTFWFSLPVLSEAA
jgi:two-component system sensor histidine kinase DctS